MLPKNRCVLFGDPSMEVICYLWELVVSGKTSNPSMGSFFLSSFKNFFIIGFHFDYRMILKKAFVSSRYRVSAAKMFYIFFNKTAITLNSI